MKRYITYFLILIHSMPAAASGRASYYKVLPYKTGNKIVLMGDADFSYFGEIDKNANLIAEKYTYQNIEVYKTQTTQHALVRVSMRLKNGFATFYLKSVPKGWQVYAKNIRPFASYNKTREDQETASSQGSAATAESAQSGGERKVGLSCGYTSLDKMIEDFISANDATKKDAIKAFGDFYIDSSCNANERALIAEGLLTHIFGKSDGDLQLADIPVALKCFFQSSDSQIEAMQVGGATLPLRSPSMASMPEAGAALLSHKAQLQELLKPDAQLVRNPSKAKKLFVVQQIRCEQELFAEPPAQPASGVQVQSNPKPVNAKYDDETKQIFFSSRFLTARPSGRGTSKGLEIAKTYLHEFTHAVYGPRLTEEEVKKRDEGVCVEPRIEIPGIMSPKIEPAPDPSSEKKPSVDTIVEPPPPDEAETQEAAALVPVTNGPVLSQDSIPSSQLPESTIRAIAARPAGSESLPRTPTTTGRTIASSSNGGNSGQGPAAMQIAPVKRGVRSTVSALTTVLSPLIEAAEAAGLPINPDAAGSGGAGTPYIATTAGSLVPIPTRQLEGTLARTGAGQSDRLPAATDAAVNGVEAPGLVQQQASGVKGGAGKTKGQELATTGQPGGNGPPKRGGSRGGPPPKPRPPSAGVATDDARDDSGQGSSVQASFKTGASINLDDENLITKLKAQKARVVRENLQGGFEVVKTPLGLADKDILLQIVIDANNKITAIVPVNTAKPRAKRP